MRFLVLICSAAWLAVAITVVYAPGFVPEWLLAEEIGPMMRKLAVFPIAMGAIFVFASRRMRLGIYIFIIGVLGIIKGLIPLIMPEQAAKILMWYANLPVWQLRAAGVIGIALALPIVISAFISLFEENVL
jgi:uncharacterized protein YjeT (DUF2065 family)